MALSLRNGEKAVNDLATQLRREITARIEQHLNSYLATPHLVNQINLNTTHLRLLNIQKLPTIERYFWQQIQLFDSVSLRGCLTPSCKLKRGGNLSKELAWG